MQMSSNKSSFSSMDLELAPLILKGYIQLKKKRFYAVVRVISTKYVLVCC